MEESCVFNLNANSKLGESQPVTRTHPCLFSPLHQFLNSIKFHFHLFKVYFNSEQFPNLIPGRPIFFLNIISTITEYTLLPPHINPNTITEYRYRIHMIKYKNRNMIFKNEKVVSRTEALPLHVNPNTIIEYRYKMHI